MDEALNRSYLECLALARQSGSNFYTTFFTLPADQFRDTCVLYAYMRRTDDLGDAPGMDIEQRREALSQWRLSLQQALQGEPDGGIFPAVADLVKRRQIPGELLIEVINGVERDLRPEFFDRFADLQQYCYQVAGVVGECCVRIWGCSGPETSARAIACGTAFQLTNILRDLAEDAARGRCYLPVEDLSRFGCTPEQLQAGELNDALRQLIRFEVARTRELYREAGLLLANLSPPGKRILRAMLGIYGGLLNEIEARDGDLFRERISLPWWRKWSIVARAWLPQ